MCTINGLQLMKYIKFYNTPTVYANTHVRIYSSFWCTHMHMHALANTRTIHTSSYSELLVHGWMLGKILVHTHTHTQQQQLYNNLHHYLYIDALFNQLTKNRHLQVASQDMTTYQSDAMAYAHTTSMGTHVHSFSQAWEHRHRQTIL